jgi:hypothetical protein
LVEPLRAIDLSCDSNLVYVLFSLIALFGLAAIADLTPLSDCCSLKKQQYKVR